jgi:membrane protease YdiL (CAAX protease family)
MDPSRLERRSAAYGAPVLRWSGRPVFCTMAENVTALRGEHVECRCPQKASSCLIILQMKGPLVPNTASPALRAQRMEVFVFLFLIVPSMVLSFFAVKKGDMSFGLVSVATILRDLSLVSLILFFLWRNAETVERIGWTNKNGWKDIGLGFVLFFPMYFGAAVIESTLHAVGFTIPSTPLPSFLAARGVPDYLLASVLVVVVAWAEETIFRGYLMLRFAAIAKSPAAAVLLSAGVFAIGHGYEGSAGVVTVFVLGLVFALVYSWRQSLVAPMIMHLLQDFVGIVLAPMLGLH